MRPIPMTELREGDIFAHSIQLRGRRSFKVLEVFEKQLMCQERYDVSLVHDTGLRPTRKQIKGFVYLLRRE